MVVGRKTRSIYAEAFVKTKRFAQASEPSDSNLLLDRGYRGGTTGRTENDMTIRSALRKRKNREFVIPLDVPSELLPVKHRLSRAAMRIAKVLVGPADQSSDE